MPQKVEQDGHVELFADDSTTFQIGDTIDDAMFKIQTTAKNLYNYACQNWLSIHPESVNSC